MVNREFEMSKLEDAVKALLENTSIKLSTFEIPFFSALKKIQLCCHNYSY